MSDEKELAPPPQLKSKRSLIFGRSPKIPRKRNDDETSASATSSPRKSSPRKGSRIFGDRGDSSVRNKDKDRDADREGVSASVGHKKGRDAQAKKGIFRGESFTTTLLSASASSSPSKQARKKSTPDTVLRGTGLTMQRSDGGALMEALNRLKVEEGMSLSSSDDDDDEDEENTEETFEEEEEAYGSKLVKWDPIEEARKAREMLVRVRAERESRQGSRVASIADRNVPERSSIIPTSAPTSRINFPASAGTSPLTPKPDRRRQPANPPSTDSVLLGAVKELEGLDVSGINFDYNFFSNSGSGDEGDSNKGEKPRKERTSGKKSGGGGTNEGNAGGEKGDGEKESSGAGAGSGGGGKDDDEKDDSDKEDKDGSGRKKRKGKTLKKKKKKEPGLPARRNRAATQKKKDNDSEMEDLPFEKLKSPRGDDGKSATTLVLRTVSSPSSAPTTPRAAPTTKSSSKDEKSSLRRRKQTVDGMAVSAFPAEDDEQLEISSLSPRPVVTSDEDTTSKKSRKKKEKKERKKDKKKDKESSTASLSQRSSQTALPVLTAQVKSDSPRAASPRSGSPRIGSPITSGSPSNSSSPRESGKRPRDMRLQHTLSSPSLRASNSDLPLSAHGSRGPTPRGVTSTADKIATVRRNSTVAVDSNETNGVASTSPPSPPSSLTRPISRENIPIPTSQAGSFSSPESSVISQAKTGEDSVSPRHDTHIRVKIREEFIETERTYVYGLQLISDLFMQPLKTGDLLRPRDFNAIFRDVPSLLTIHKTLLVDLIAAEEQEHPHEAFIRALQYLAPFFKMYFVYVNQYDSANERLKELLYKGGKFAAFIKECESRPECKSLDLASYLLTPIQRLPRYELLLKEYLKNTTDEKEKETIRALIHSIQDVNKFVNHSKNEAMQRKQLYQLQKAAKNSVDLFSKPGRQIVKEGVLQISEIIDREPKDIHEGPLRIFLLKRPGNRMSSTFKEFHCFLLDDMFIIMNGEQKKDRTKYKYVTHFFLHSVALESISTIASPSASAGDTSQVFMMTTLSRMSDRKGDQGDDESLAEAVTSSGSRDSQRFCMRRFCVKTRDTQERNEWKDEIYKRSAGNLEQMLDHRKNARRSGVFRPGNPDDLQKSSLAAPRKPLTPADAERDERRQSKKELLKKFGAAQPALVAYVLNERKTKPDIVVDIETGGSESDVKIRIEELEQMKMVQTQRVAEALAELERIEHELVAQKERLKSLRAPSGQSSQPGSRLEGRESRKGSQIERKGKRRSSSRPGSRVEGRESRKGSLIEGMSKKKGSKVERGGSDRSLTWNGSLLGNLPEESDDKPGLLIAPDDEIRICVACGGEIEDTAVKVGNNRYHPEHFLCTSCHCQLGGKDYFPVGPEEQPYCVDCYANRKKKLNCAACATNISGTYMQMLNKNWHRQCMTCALCKVPFYSSEGHALGGIMAKDGDLVCRTCFNTTWSKNRVCSKCGLPVTIGEDEDIMSPVSDRCWHKECFSCKQCGAILPHEDEGEIDWKESFPYCKLHRSGSQTTITTNATGATAATTAATATVDPVYGTSLAESTAVAITRSSSSD